jgi:hypothetical protein
MSERMLSVSASWAPWVRPALVVLAAAGFLTGVWAFFAPESFFRDFPGFGLHWVDRLPSYNEHLVRDVGAFYLAFAVLFGWAALTRNTGVATGASVGWVVAQLPHALFHLAHLEGLSTVDVIGQSGGQLGLVGLALAVPLALSRR